jgi:hypothetical protein
MSDWYYRIGQRVYGPYSEEDLRGRIKSGQIPSSTSVSRNGFTDWHEASESLFENQGRPRKTPRSTILRQRLAGLFKRPLRARGLKTGSWTRARKRFLSWCLWTVFAGIIAWILVVIAESQAGREWVRRLSAAFQASAPSQFTLEQTRNYWLGIREIKKTAEVSLGQMRAGQYPLNDAGQPDMLSFTNKDFENFRQLEFKREKIARDCVEKLGKLPALGVDPALLHYKLELRELWMLVDRACVDYTDITSDIEEQRSCFASPEAYALRFGTNSAGPSEMEYRNHKSQLQITEKIRQLNLLLGEGTEAMANVSNREQEVKTLLTSRYGWKFE